MLGKNQIQGIGKFFTIYYETYFIIRDIRKNLDFPKALSSDIFEQNHPICVSMKSSISRELNNVI